MVHEKMKMAGKLIKHARELKGYRQCDVAEKIDISTQHYAGIEQGRTGMSLERAIKISEVLDVSLDILFAKDNSWKDCYYIENANLLIECFRADEKNLEMVMRFAEILKKTNTDK